ncbi:MULTISPECIES: ABC transporter ATP-binding protein [Cytobacillus]|uniref:ABC transporter ATP-binding protein n=1 Tax=Cytobacillus TaxID=2675230 RepID=UPI001CD51853|nr:ABC transporter ATP-binding protein [Cytobacillus kochii]MCA1025061.1 ABC transporter ATP-binding protein [Cytobacillus kochii]MDM5206701.1 ABC transporter ATP-binding protein [Cytobacillus kochii]MDQ0187163.1 branched-chain amino acid transport system ATP-binding protein [Cytobacillus kochii]
MIELKEVHSYYGHSHILHGVNLKVNKGQCVALLGRNGAGKTTTIHSIAGLVVPKEGTIQFKDKELVGRTPNHISKAGVGLVPQGRRVFPSLTVKENLLIAERKSISSEKQWTIEEVYQLFPILKEREENMGNELSGGQQQMLAIGRALLLNPDFLLMDEPSEGLAPVIIEQIKNIILDVKKTGLSMLIVEQNIDLACCVADEVIILNKGEVVWQGFPAELLHNDELLKVHLGV